MKFNKDATVSDFDSGYNWASALEVCLRDGIIPALGESVVTDGFAASDIEEVIAAAEGQNDGDPWAALVRLKDGRFVALTAWCDYTGWGCQDGGQAVVGRTLESTFGGGFDPAQRDRLLAK